MAKIHVFKYRESLKKGLTLLAGVDKDKAMELINEGLKMEPTNQRLLNMANMLN